MLLLCLWLRAIKRQECSNIPCTLHSDLLTHATGKSFSLSCYIKSDVPGPGTYGKGGVPSATIEEKEKRSMSNVGMLDSGKSDRQLPEVVRQI